MNFIIMMKETNDEGKKMCPGIEGSNLRCDYCEKKGMSMRPSKITSLNVGYPDLFKIRNLASAELCATSKYEVVGYLIYK